MQHHVKVARRNHEIHLRICRIALPKYIHLFDFVFCFIFCFSDSHHFTSWHETSRYPPSMEINYNELSGWHVKRWCKKVRLEITISKFDLSGMADFMIVVILCPSNF